MRPTLAGVLTLLCLVPTAAQPTFPQAEITNGRIRAVLHLPDPQAGHYRATRFDWSGSIASAEWKGHTYFGQWYARHDPRVNDAITGPVEEFDSIGYDDAKPGERFIRLGVGAIQKPDEPAYRRFSTYEIADPGKWTINRSAGAIEFVHELGNTRGYAYVYRKTVRLDGDRLVLEHRLQNTGTKAIVTNGYNHDFFMLDNQPTGPDFVIKFPFAPTAVTPQAISGVVELRGNEWVYVQEVQRAVQTAITGFGPTANDNDFRVENRRTGAAVRQTGDQPLTRINVWSPRTAICPEAFIDVRAEPGKETTWRISYEFYEVNRM
jgi:hypothetical protein